MCSDLYTYPLYNSVEFYVIFINTEMIFQMNDWMNKARDNDDDNTDVIIITILIYKTHVTVSLFIHS